MPKDIYSSFTELLAKEVEGVDYRIELLDRGSENLIMAPHGGRIERGTSEIARSIASKHLSLYLFEGIRPGLEHHELHVTSHKYDEPQALWAVSKSMRVLAIHGRADRRDTQTIWIGGRDTSAHEVLLSRLQSAGFKCQIQSKSLAGKHSNNICNRGISARGVQLEIPRSLRDELLENDDQLRNLSTELRESMLELT
ncbi:poly-gamma-glutamate hydrolase family protein [Anderseniella sp. Alg231-50]|uniref:poly-gamma-glutamate hydrolase family protein n=1 Tax=Anderseniella sp. Alg231-50 TaxID=1922226 RepID=UPI003FCDAF77